MDSYTQRYVCGDRVRAEEALDVDKRAKTKAAAHIPNIRSHRVGLSHK